MLICSQQQRVKAISEHNKRKGLGDFFCLFQFHPLPCSFYRGRCTAAVFSIQLVDLKIVRQGYPQPENYPLSDYDISLIACEVFFFLGDQCESPYFVNFLFSSARFFSSFLACNFFPERLSFLQHGYHLLKVTGHARRTDDSLLHLPQ